MANEKNSELLGINFSTANNALRKQIIFYLAGALGLLQCFQCKDTIETIEEFSIEHKAPWRRADNPKKAFFDIENISFSHLTCNSRDGGMGGRKYLTDKDRNRAKNKRCYADPDCYERHLNRKRKHADVVER